MTFHCQVEAFTSNSPSVATVKAERLILETNIEDCEEPSPGRLQSPPQARTPLNRDCSADQVCTSRLGCLENSDSRNPCQHCRHKLPTSYPLGLPNPFLSAILFSYNGCDGDEYHSRQAQRARYGESGCDAPVGTSLQSRQSNGVAPSRPGRKATVTGPGHRVVPERAPRLGELGWYRGNQSRPLWTGFFVARHLSQSRVQSRPWSGLAGGTGAVPPQKQIPPSPRWRRGTGG